MGEQADKGLKWALGDHDPRKDHKDDRLLFAIVVGLGTFGTIFIVFIFYDIVDEKGMRILIAGLVAIWLILFFTASAFLVYRRFIGLDIFTRVDLTPLEASDRLEKGLPEGVNKLGIVAKVPWPFDEYARFKITKDWKEEAVVIVAVIGEDPNKITEIRVRSSIYRDGWEDLKGLIEEAFHDVGTQGIWGEHQFLDSPE
jgi:hypothetical protein